MSIRILSFTDRGQALAERLSGKLPGTAMRCGKPLSLDQWAAQAWMEADALIFVGAAGIAVRAVAPLVEHKTRDPAVVVVDESGRWAISLLSGHLGGANDLAGTVAEICGGEAVITTATDLRGVFAVDEWARRQGCVVINPERIRHVSGRLLSGESIRVHSQWPVDGTPPQGVELAAERPWDVRMSLDGSEPEALQIVPRILVLGVGCRRGISAGDLETAFRGFLEKSGLPEEAFFMAASIDLKAGEPGLLTFCENHGLPLKTFSAAELVSVPGAFSGSGFVQQTTGVDNVCERSAVKAGGGTLIHPKEAGNGVTMAAAAKPFYPDWRWRHG